MLCSPEQGDEAYCRFPTKSQDVSVATLAAAAWCSIHNQFKVINNCFGWSKADSSETRPQLADLRPGRLYALRVIPLPDVLPPLAVLPPQAPSQPALVTMEPAAPDAPAAPTTTRRERKALIVRLLATVCSLSTRCLLVDV